MSIGKCLTNNFKSAIIACVTVLNEIYSYSVSQRFISLEQLFVNLVIMRFERSNLKKWDLAVLICVQRGFSGALACTSSYWNSPCLTWIVYAFGCKNFFRLLRSRSRFETAAWPIKPHIHLWFTEQLNYEHCEHCAWGSRYMSPKNRISKMCY